ILTATAPSKIDLEQLKISESEGLLGSLLAQRARLQQHAEAALECGSVHVAVAAEGKITENLRLVSQLLGQLTQVHEVRHSVLVSPDYLRLRQVLIETLGPYPDAALAVGQALHQLEAQATKDIEQRARDEKRPLVTRRYGSPTPASSRTNGSGELSARSQDASYGFAIARPENRRRPR